MKRALLLSVVASVAVMAGGDIVPAPVVEESNWEWSGTAKVYYQTMDHKNHTWAKLPLPGHDRCSILLVLAIVFLIESHLQQMQVFN